ncbi:MAG: hypothetical protein DYH13_09730 [Alphaproteobacteria bacterium PRO2]|nr:hypothetical protein [Alphaproteobacteria bacterium PRO2]
MPENDTGPDTPVESAEFLAKKIADKDKPTTLVPLSVPDRTELLQRLQDIFNEAREERRSFRAVRVAFSVAVGLSTSVQNNIFNVQSPDGAIQSAAVLVLFTTTALISNQIIHRRIAELTETGRLADEQIKQISGKDFPTYLQVFNQAFEKVEAEKDAKKRWWSNIIPHKHKKILAHQETQMLSASLAVAFLISAGSIRIKRRQLMSTS